MWLSSPPVTPIVVILFPNPVCLRDTLYDSTVAYPGAVSSYPLVGNGCPQRQADPFVDLPTLPAMHNC